MKKPNPFLKKAAGPKPPNRRQMKRGLGTGLDTLLGEAPAKTAATPSVVAPPPVRPAAALASVPPAPPANAVIEVPPLDIERSPWQPRTEFAEGPLNELADSIRANGIIEPIVCRRRADGKLDLICIGFCRIPSRSRRRTLPSAWARVVRRSPIRRVFWSFRRKCASWCVGARSRPATPRCC